MASVAEGNTAGSRITDRNHVQTLETDTATITFTGAADDDTDSDDSVEQVGDDQDRVVSKDSSTTGGQNSGHDVNVKDEDNKEQKKTEVDQKTAQSQQRSSPARFNPFDREDYKEDIRNVFPQLARTSAPPAKGSSPADNREDQVPSVSSESWLDCEDIIPASSTSEQHLGLKEDYFAQPDGFDYTSIDNLKLAIEDYKQKVLKSTAHTETRRQLVQKLVELRMKLAEAEEGPSKEDPDVKHVVGHHFQKKDGTSGQRFCEKCNGVIWGVLQTWYRCADCGFCCHTKCLNLITRICASVRVTENPHYIMSVCPEKGLGGQNYRCLECRAPISFQNGFGEPRQCDYTGAYYCEVCHWNDTMIIPARVLHNWDFEPRKVCRASKQFLKLMSLKSVLRIQDINPMLFNFVEELNEVKKLREEILIMKRYFLSCKAALDSKLLLQLQDRQHFVENSDMYSLFDLEEVVEDTLMPHLAKIHTSFAQHIKTDCQLCQGKGYICELCGLEEVLFPFDNHAIVCSQCSTVLHRHCYMRRQQRCPKCQRVEKRNGGIPDLSELTGNTVALTTEDSLLMVS